MNTYDTAIHLPMNKARLHLLELAVSAAQQLCCPTILYCGRAITIAHAQHLLDHYTGYYIA